MLASSALVLLVSQWLGENPDFKQKISTQRIALFARGQRL